ncbi:MAG: CRISPR-associated helicase Cas3' [Akkermansia sp.]
MSLILPPYAHTLESCPPEEWEPLYTQGEVRGHAEKVAELCREFCHGLAGDAKTAEQWASLGYVLGLYHDMGKATPEFQQYLRDSAAGRPSQSVDHKSAAAKWVLGQHPAMGILLSYVFHGHHSGLPNMIDLFSSLSKGAVAEKLSLLELLPESMRSNVSIPMPERLLKDGDAALCVYRLCLLTRMFHSCLVDADWLATESFMDARTSRLRSRRSYASIAELSGMVESALAAKEKASAGGINALRARIHHACFDAGRKGQGVYQLNVPTGGGKTLSSLSFALHHALHHGMERVIYVIPFTSIIEQTAREFRELLGAENVIEHHSNLNETSDTLDNKFGSENWDAPLIVTTNVQFFETLYACKNNRCRKLHNMARSVIIFDEVQTLPTDFLAPCLASMRGLQQCFGCTLLLCSATQPAVTNRQHLFDIGWSEGEVQSLIGVDFERELSEKMKRVEITKLGLMTQAELAADFLDTGADSALFIVNLTAQAQALYEHLQCLEVEGVYHLSARMCPAHRGDVLTIVRERLRAGEPCVLVATRVVEAGVDISFPIVYRDRCGLDSLAQSAGRCNRHGERPIGQCFSFEAAEKEYQLPAAFVDQKRAVEVLRDLTDCEQSQDYLDLAFIERYFQEFYLRRREATCTWDKQHLLSDLVGRQLAGLRAWDFPEMSKRFSLIPQSTRSLMVLYNDDARALREELIECQQYNRMPNRAQFRRLQQYSVSVYAGMWERLAPFMSCEHQAADIYILSESGGVYDANVGLLNEGEEDYLV